MTDADAVFRCIEDAAAVRAGLLAWLDALRGGASDPAAKRWRFAHAGGWAKVQPPGSKDKPAALRDMPDVTLGLDPAMDSAVVMINAPSVPGDANGLSAVATDRRNRRWLLRQGFLRRQRADDITQPLFDRVTRMKPVRVIMQAGRGRTWYRVAMLDGPAERIQAQTTAFVEQCALVRAHYDPDAVMTPASLNLAALLTGTPEAIHTHDVPPQDGYSVAGTHARVWQALHGRLAEHCIVSGKPPPSGGFEVDLVVLANPSPLLVEIKTSAEASSVHAGVGQLMLYRRIFPELARCEPVLMLPEGLNPVLADAVRACGLTLSFYQTGSGEVEFEPSFLGRCGLTVPCSTPPGALP